MIEHYLRQFLKKFHDGRPLLLALSGGPDSMSLFHGLVELSIAFEVAHVNHHWRSVSSQEAERLKELCANNNTPFHIKNLSITGSNLEDRCRTARLDFFRQVVQERELQAVVLGHHAGDLAETVLKRLFEGARLTKLGAFQEVTHMEGLILFRPLLPVSKVQILKFLETKRLWYFHDETNEDKRFLRARLRHDLIPQLEQVFGKNIESSLARIAYASTELQEDILKRVESYPIYQKDACYYLDLTHKQPLSDFEWKMLLMYFFEQIGESASSGTILQLMQLLKQGQADKSLRLKNSYVKLNRRLLCLQPMASRNKSIIDV